MRVMLLTTSMKHESKIRIVEQIFLKLRRFIVTFAILPSRKAAE